MAESAPKKRRITPQLVPASDSLLEAAPTSQLHQPAFGDISLREQSRLSQEYFGPGRRIYISLHGEQYHVNLKKVRTCCCNTCHGHAEFLPNQDFQCSRCSKLRPRRLGPVLRPWVEDGCRLPQPHRQSRSHFKLVLEADILHIDRHNQLNVRCLQPSSLPVAPQPANFMTGIIGRMEQRYLVRRTNFHLLLPCKATAMLLSGISSFHLQRTDFTFWCSMGKQVQMLMRRLGRTQSPQAIQRCALPEQLSKMSSF